MARPRIARNIEGRAWHDGLVDDKILCRENREWYFLSLQDIRGAKGTISSFFKPKSQTPVKREAEESSKGDSKRHKA